MWNGIVAPELIKHHAMKTWGSGGIAPSFLISALDGSEWSATGPTRFTVGEGAPVPIILVAW
jgi:hypothetical protein